MVLLEWTAQRHLVPIRVAARQLKTGLMKFKRIAVDTSKRVFTLHSVDEQDGLMLRQDLKRHQVEPFFTKLTSTEVVLEACGGSHHWSRVLLRLATKSG